MRPTIPLASRERRGCGTRRLSKTANWPFQSTRLRGWSCQLTFIVHLADKSTKWPTRRLARTFVARSATRPSRPSRMCQLEMVEEEVEVVVVEPPEDLRIVERPPYRERDAPAKRYRRDIDDEERSETSERRRPQETPSHAPGFSVVEAIPLDYPMQVNIGVGMGLVLQLISVIITRSGGPPMSPSRCYCCPWLRSFGCGVAPPMPRTKVTPSSSAS